MNRTWYHSRLGLLPILHKSPYISLSCFSLLFFILFPPPTSTSVSSVHLCSYFFLHSASSSLFCPKVLTTLTCPILACACLDKQLWERSFLIWHAKNHSWMQWCQCPVSRNPKCHMIHSVLSGKVIICWQCHECQDPRNQKSVKGSEPDVGEGLSYAMDVKIQGTRCQSKTAHNNHNKRKFGTPL